MTLKQWLHENRFILIIAGVLAFADLFILPAALGNAGEWFLLNLAAGGGFLYWQTGRKPSTKPRTTPASTPATAATAGPGRANCEPTSSGTARG